MRQPGLRAVCIREVQNSLKESSKRLIEAKLSELGLGEADGFKSYDKLIATPGDGTIFFRGMQDATATRLMSLEKVDRAWIDEAQALSHRSLALLRPTIRAEDSEIWASWNPTHKNDAIDDLLRGHKPFHAITVAVSWQNNPWFPKVLEEERLSDLQMYPDRYEHVWEGGYLDAFAGKLMPQAEATVASATVCDIGGATSTAVVITGNVSISSFGTVPNCIRFVRFAGALTLTHNATSLVLLGGASHSTNAGDTAIYKSDASGYWRELSYCPATFNPTTRIWTADTNGGPLVALVNPNLGTGAYNAFQLTNGRDAFSFQLFGQNFPNGLQNKPGGGQIHATGPNGITYWADQNAHHFYVGNTEWAAISASGVSVPGATVSPDTGSGGKITLTGWGTTGTINYNGSITTNDGNGIRMVCVANGVILNNSATSWASLSDERLKTPFIPFDSALAKIASIRAGTGRYWTDADSVSRSFLSAQSVRAVLPQAVDEDKDGMLTLRYNDIVPLLVAALQEQGVITAGLQARLDALEAS